MSAALPEDDKDVSIPVNFWELLIFGSLFTGGFAYILHSIIALANGQSSAQITDSSAWTLFFLAITTITFSSMALVLKTQRNQFMVIAVGFLVLCAVFYTVAFQLK